MPVPSFGPRLLLGRELAGELLFASQRVQPAGLERAGYQFEHPTLEGALRWAVSKHST
jgi:NAD dependent epimerase/dehydratase family enzyme